MNALIATFCLILATCSAGVINSGLWSQVGGQSILNSPYGMLAGGQSGRFLVNPTINSWKRGLFSPIVSERLIGNIGSTPLVRESMLDILSTPSGKPMIETVRVATPMDIERNILTTPIISGRTLMNNEPVLLSRGVPTVAGIAIPDVMRVDPLVERSLIDNTELLSQKIARQVLASSQTERDILRMSNIATDNAVPINPLMGGSLLGKVAVMNGRVVPDLSLIERDILSAPIAGGISDVLPMGGLLTGRSMMGNAELMSKKIDRTMLSSAQIERDMLRMPTVAGIATPIAMPINPLTERSLLGNVALMNNRIVPGLSQLERNILLAPITEQIGGIGPIRAPLIGNAELLSQKVGLQSQLLTQAERDIIATPTIASRIGVPMMPWTGRSLIENVGLNTRTLSELSKLERLMEARQMESVGQLGLSMNGRSLINDAELMSGRIGLPSQIERDLMTTSLAGEIPVPMGVQLGSPMVALSRPGYWNRAIWNRPAWTRPVWNNFARTGLVGNQLW